MKNSYKYCVIFLGLLFLESCKSIAQVPATMHPIVNLAKETSLYTEKVNWQEVNTKFVELTDGKEGIEELKEGLQYLINSLGDKHAAVRSANDFSLIVSYTGESQNEDDELSFDGEFFNTVINDVTAQFTYQLLDDKIGYLKVVGIGPGDVKEQADFIREGLKDLKNQGVNKWIVDLRYNGGGNMEPMISGLAPLIGEGKIGGAVNYRDEMSREYTIENGEFNNNGRIACPMENTPKISPDEKVVVLLSRYTISSGEMVAITFKGRENTRFIGERTAGYTTGNGFDRINDDLVLLISQDVFADRHHNTYFDNVGVDDFVLFQHHVDMENDNQLKKAITWLKE